MKMGYLPLEIIIFKDSSSKVLVLPRKTSNPRIVLHSLPHIELLQWFILIVLQSQLLAQEIYFLIELTNSVFILNASFFVLPTLQTICIYSFDQFV